MEEQNGSNSEKKMEEMLSTMGNYMSSKLNQRIVSIRKRLEEVKKSENKNKIEVEKKLTELIEVMTKIAEKTEIQTKTQKELIELMNTMSNLDMEIDNLLINDGSK